MAVLWLYCNVLCFPDDPLEQRVASVFEFSVCLLILCKIFSITLARKLHFILFISNYKILVVNLIHSTRHYIVRALGARSRGSKISHTGNILVTDKRVNTEPIQLETPKVLAPACYDIKRSIREKSSLCNWFLCFFSVCSLCLFFLQMVTLIHNFDFLHFLIHP